MRETYQGGGEEEMDDVQSEMKRKTGISSLSTLLTGLFHFFVCLKFYTFTSRRDLIWIAGKRGGEGGVNSKAVVSRGMRGDGFGLAFHGTEQKMMEEKGRRGF